MKPNTIYFFKPHLMPEKIGLIDPGDGVLNASFSEAKPELQEG